jgi:DNA-binding transcriptional LysR family regulator
VRILPAWSLESGGIYAVTPATRFRRARVNAFLNVLIECERRRPQMKQDGVP